MRHCKHAALVKTVIGKFNFQVLVCFQTDRAKHVVGAAETLKKFTILYPLLNHKSKFNIPNEIAIYKAIVCTTMLYACPVWVESACALRYINKLQTIQSKYLKFVLNLLRNYPTCIFHRITKTPIIKEQISISYNLRCS